MGPLVPEIIGNELNFIVAFLIRIAFGFILEQAGFSTSKKLVGLFYGYDFTVLRVFFTAGITAMLGVIALNHFGLLDVSLIYINPTFLWSAIIGGAIMGLGFVIGGYCPGTSVAGAAIGKIDAMFFILGSAVGVLIFAEGYPVFEGLYKSADWGNVRAFDSLGISQSLFAFLLTFIAVFAFWVTTIIEQKVNGKPNPEFKSKPLYASLAILAILMGLTAFIMPDRKESMMNKINDTGFVKSYTMNSMDSDELAFRLMYDDNKLRIWDLRLKKDYDKLSLPGSHNITMQNLFDNATSKLLYIEGKINIFIAEDELLSKKAGVLASELGLNNVYYLKGGMNEFYSSILNFKCPVLNPNEKLSDTDRFRAEACNAVPQLIKDYKKKHSADSEGNKKSKRALGGC